jgi:hypothetical protein
LHPKWRVNDSITDVLVESVSFDYPRVPRGFYCVYDINELNDDVENENKIFPMIGLGDFFFFNLLILIVIPLNSSMTTRLCTAFVCIMIIQLGNLCTGCFISYDDSKGIPAVPFPTIFVTGYVIAVDAIIQYSNTPCENSLK